MRSILSILSSGRWYEWFPLSPVSQHPTRWRFLAHGYFRGTSSLGVPSETSWVVGYGVFDWDYTKNKYELVRFDQTPSYWDYQPSRGTVCMSWVDDVTVRVVGGSSDSGSDTTRHAAKFQVSEGGSFTFLENSSTHCGNDSISNATFSPGWAVGYNGAVVYPYGDGSTPSSNCYLGRLTNTNSATNLGPTRGGLSTGGFNAPLASLGSSAAGNGYAVGVQYCGNDNNLSIYPALYNIASTTPSVQASFSYPGSPNTLGPIHIGARKVVIGESADQRRGMLLYTNSDTSPTSLTLGSSVVMPTLPFRPGDVSSSFMWGGYANAQNFWVSEGKGATLVAYDIGQNFEAGETQRYYHIPCKLTSTDASNLSISILDTDMYGASVPLTTWFYSNLAATQPFSFQMVGAPDSKAVLMWRLGLWVNASQTVFQL